MECEGEVGHTVSCKQREGEDENKVCHQQRGGGENIVSHKQQGGEWKSVKNSKRGRGGTKLIVKNERREGW